jgi:potassium-transporting ATPase KdpC subunit
MISTLKVAIRFTLITTILLGLVYPLVMTGVAHVLWRDKADGQLITKNSQVIGSSIIGQSFTSDGYFHGRPSSAGNGNDAAKSTGAKLAISTKKMDDRINVDEIGREHD